MHMSFWWSSDVGDFLFYGYIIHTAGGLVATCFGLAALGLFVEWLKLIQARHRQKELKIRVQQIHSICPSENEVLLNEGRNRRLQVTAKNRALLFASEVFIWFNLQILSYLLMLIVMTYNGWMLISIVLGSTVGFFLFGPSFIKINLQNCQMMRDTYCMYNCSEPEAPGESTPTLGSTSAPALDEMTPDTPICQAAITVHVPAT